MPDLEEAVQVDESRGDDERTVEEILADVHDLFERGMQQMRSEILDALEGAIGNARSGPELGTENDYGQNEVAGLQAAIDEIRDNF
jgi:hypothetical protein